jgi:deoxycytidine triphosphate deaminase
MILTDQEIENLYNSLLLDESKSYLIYPFDLKALNSASYDLHLGFSAGHVRPQFLNRKKVGFKKITNFYDRTKEDPYWLAPNDFILVSTLERISLPDNISGQLHLKSSRAREGLSHTLAGKVAPGFSGILTLELKNYLKDAFVPIYPGMAIVHIVFEQHEKVRNSYKNGRYSKFIGVCPSLDDSF